MGTLKAAIPGQAKWAQQRGRDIGIAYNIFNLIQYCLLIVPLSDRLALPLNYNVELEINQSNAKDICIKRLDFSFINKLFCIF